jgi:RimJ/RimL family protein N-acetyltransferase
VYRTELSAVPNASKTKPTLKIMQQPTPFPHRLTAQRLALRRYVTSDVPEVLRLMQANRDRLLRSFRELAMDLSTVEEVLAYVEKTAAGWSDCTAFVYGIWFEHDNDLVGQLTVKTIIWNVPSAELSYFVDRNWLRRGVAVEAIQAVLQQAFERGDFKRLFVRIIEINSESVALAHRMGFRHEGVLRRAFRCGFGELHDVHIFAMTDRDYHERSKVT